MKLLFLSLSLLCATLLPARAIETDEASPMLYPDLLAYIDARTQEFERIPEERRDQLDELTAFVRDAVRAGKPADLTFICTHNSRRSHLAQVWSQVAATHFGIEGITCYSGGTEATACNPRTVAAMRRAGFHVDQTTQAKNPIYHVRFAEETSPVTCFSKVYGTAPNPQEGFCAIMTCTSADEACPIVMGAAKRVSIPYEDPKAFDGSDKEAQAYDERCAQICREMFFVFSRI